MAGRLKAYESLRLSMQYPSTYARRMFDRDSHISNFILDWTVHSDGEEQDGLILLPFFSTRPGAAPGLLIYDELRVYDIIFQGAKERHVVPSSDPYTFSVSMNVTILKRMTNNDSQEDTEPLAEAHSYNKEHTVNVSWSYGIGKNKYMNAESGYTGDFAGLLEKLAAPTRK
ncbi:hypothetical protein GQ53DRAFT_834555 [Thozetella sp. PMI_491]|nr:hypothetical protein GQ53DRAFT_834555 [Thozetella sp. PMI_491]